MPKYGTGAFSTPNVFLFRGIWPVALKPMRVPEVQNTYVQGVLQLNCHFPEGSLPIINPASSKFNVISSTHLTGRDWEQVASLFTSVEIIFYYTSSAPLFSDSHLFQGKELWSIYHCSYSTPLASKLKNRSTDKHKCSERTAFDCRHCYERIYPGWLMAFSFQLRHACFICPVLKKFIEPWHHLLHIHSQEYSGNAYAPAERKGGAKFLETLPYCSYLSFHEVITLNLTQSSLGPQQNFH